MGSRKSQVAGQKSLASIEMATVKKFEELRIWNDSRALVNEVYKSLSNSEEGSKDWGFRNQIQQAAISVMNNIAEGYERDSDKDFARFLDIAKASCGEVRSMLYIGQDLEYFDEALARQMRSDAAKIAKGIATLSKHLRKS